jgi:hypothetical protein
MYVRDSCMVGKRCWSRRDICLRHSTYDTRQYLDNVYRLSSHLSTELYAIGTGSGTAIVLTLLLFSRRLWACLRQCTHLMTVLLIALGLPPPGSRPMSVLT